MSRPRSASVAWKRIPVLVFLLGWGLTAHCAPRRSVRKAEDSRSAFPVPSSVRVVRDLVYARYGDRELLLDLYLPAGAPDRETVPGVIVVRGGGWQAGDKETFGFIAAHLPPPMESIAAPSGRSAPLRAVTW